LDDVIAFLIAGTDLTFVGFLTLSGVSFLGSFVTAALGLGGGVLVLASMAVFLPPVALIPLHGVVQLGSNVGRTALMTSHVLYKVLPHFAVGTVIGSAIGANMFVALPVGVLQLALALFVLYATWAQRFKVSRPGPAKFGVLGLVSGFVTMFVGGSGPLIAPFASAVGDDKKIVVATHAALMSMQHIVKLAAFGFLGFAFGPYIPFLAGALALGFAGTWAGRHVLNRLPERAFRIGLQIILTLLAARLLYAAAVSLLA
jgi:uncharacterized membrane protein YfcA